MRGVLNVNIQGITVLSEKVIFEPTAFGILTMVIGIFFVCMSFYIFCEKSLKGEWKLPLIVGLLIFFCGVFFHKFPFYKSDVVEFKCVINETASFTEVYEKFTIEDVEGKIWTIRTKGE